jgi:hypothetical protein
MFQEQQRQQPPVAAPQQDNNLLQNFNGQDIQNNFTNTFDSIKNTFGDTKNSLQQSMNDFSSASVVNASNEFVQSNSLIAKFGFIMLVLIGFLFLFRFGMMIISYFFSPSTSPYLVKGMISGNESAIIKQDPKQGSSIVNYSENDPAGLAFTYSVWLSLTDSGTDTTNYRHIFNKGIMGNLNAGVNSLSNAPGMYVKSNTDGTNTLRVYMDTFSNNGQIQNIEDQRTTIDVGGIPFKKWVNVMIRAENRVMDIYVNGVLTQHKDLQYVPKQNFGDVYVCQNGGFAGKLSDLRYYAKALNVFEINGIVGWGPNLSTSALSPSAIVGKDYSYLSYMWYKSNQ